MNEYGIRVPDSRMIPVWQPPKRHSREQSEEEATPPDDSDRGDVAVRPFLMTGGRTRPVRDGLRVETLVSSPPAALSAPLRFELRQIVELAQDTVSIAEIAVRLGIPLGVARVLVADLITDGMVSCSESAELPIEMIERIRDRVRAL
jgi:hypothetical protein